MQKSSFNTDQRSPYNSYFKPGGVGLNAKLEKQMEDGIFT